MKVVRLDQIRLDGGTQMREHLDQDVVKDYAEKMREGAVFPPLITVFDGTTHWLVDGFHRYFAIQAAGKQGHSCEVHNGTLEDAIFMATAVNGTHGLQRSNATKKKCVEVALASIKTKGWSNVQIAKHCGVSDTFVAAVRDPEAKAKQAEKVKRHFEKKSTSVKPTPTEETETSVKPSLAQDFGPSEDEIRASERAHSEFLELMQEAFESDDVLADTSEKLKQSLLELHHLKITNNGLVNTNTELTKMVKSLQRQLDKAKK